MSEHNLKKRANGKLFKLQRLCVQADVQNWMLHFQRSIRAANGGLIDMYVVRQRGGPPEKIISIGMGHGDDATRDFFERLFQSAIPMIAGSLLLLDLYDTLVKMEKTADWNDDVLRRELSDKIGTIRKSVEPYD